MAEARREVETGNVFPLGKTCRAIIAKQCPGLERESVGSYDGGVAQDTIFVVQRRSIHCHIRSQIR
jgi:hypothetical protein